MKAILALCYIIIIGFFTVVNKMPVEQVPKSWLYWTAIAAFIVGVLVCGVCAATDPQWLKKMLKRHEEK